MVSEIQRECVFPEVVPIGIRDVNDLIQNAAEPKPVDESVVQCNGRMGHLGDSKRRETADHRVHRECNHDGTVHSSSAVDIRREDRNWLEEDTVAKREDSIYLFGKH